MFFFVLFAFFRESLKRVKNCSSLTGGRGFLKHILPQGGSMVMNPMVQNIKEKNQIQDKHGNPLGPKRPTC